MKEILITIVAALLVGCDKLNDDLVKRAYAEQIAFDGYKQALMRQGYEFEDKETLRTNSFNGTIVFMYKAPAGHDLAFVQREGTKKHNFWHLFELKLINGETEFKKGVKVNRPAAK